jgi:template-activating factor I
MAPQIETANPLDTTDTPKEQIDLLEKTQKEIDRVDIAFERKHALAMRPSLEKRREIIKQIPHFWGSALAHHPEIAELLQSNEDREALTYLEDVWVEHDPLEFRALTITFTFKENPYFHDKVLTKKYEFVPTSGRSTHIGEDGVSESMLEFIWDDNIKPSTQQIQWKDPAKALTKTNPRVMEEGGEDIDELGSFFNIFELKDEEEDFAYTIGEEIFPEAINYYLGKVDGGVWLTDDEDEDEDEDEDFDPKK